MLTEMLRYGTTDWWVFAEATRVFISGGNPYTVQLRNDVWLRVFEPPWTYAILVPFAVLPEDIGRISVFFFGFCVFAYSSVRMGARPWQMAMFLLSPPVMGSLYEGNIDWLVTAGLWMLPEFGMFLVLMKPQIGIGIAVYWGIMAWKNGGFRRLAHIFLPVVTAYLASFTVYGLWIFNMTNMHQNPVSVSVFPYSIAIGFMLMVEAVSRKEQNLSTIASPFFSPYLTIYNLSGVLLSLFDRKRLFITAWILLWIPTLVRVFIS